MCKFFLFSPRKTTANAPLPTIPSYALTGIWAPYRNARGYRYASPDGDCRLHETSTTHSVAHPSSDHSSLITVHLPYPSYLLMSSRTAFSSAAPRRSLATMRPSRSMRNMLGMERTP